MTTIILSNGNEIEVPDGADPIAFRRFVEARLRQLANPKPRNATSRRNAGHSKRSRYAAMQSVIGRAALTLIERVNGKEEDRE